MEETHNVVRDSVVIPFSFVSESLPFDLSDYDKKTDENRLVRFRMKYVRQVEDGTLVGVCGWEVRKVSEKSKRKTALRFPKAKVETTDLSRLAAWFKDLNAKGQIGSVLVAQF